MKHYTHLTSEQRYQISNGLKQGYSQQTIANIIGVNKSTISREIHRNGAVRAHVRRRTAGAGAYRPAGAHKQAMARRVGKSEARISRQDWQLIERLLQEKWSPEQISLWLGKTDRMAVSTWRMGAGNRICTSCAKRAALLLLARGTARANAKRLAWRPWR